MGRKRDAIEAVTWLFNSLAVSAKLPPENPGSIFVLRNNDIGDLLVVTPLFEALKRRFPQAKLVAGIGSWNCEVLANNPFVDEVLPVNAPWHNQRTKPQGLLPALAFLAASAEMKEIKRRRFDIGIDVLGSPFGSWLMMRANIPWRLGVTGYAGGQSGVHQSVRFDPVRHVADAALDFASLLGADVLPEARPQLFLTESEKSTGNKLWSCGGGMKRVVVAPGGGYRAKCWPVESYADLLGRIGDAELIVIGGENDRGLADIICGKNPRVRNLVGQLTLREVFALISGADSIICNSSMAMHVAAAFHKPSLVLLGEAFPSANDHSRQWAYPESCLLGREPDGRRVASVEDAFFAYAEALPGVGGKTQISLGHSASPKP